MPVYPTPYRTLIPTRVESVQDKLVKIVGCDEGQICVTK